MSKTNFLLVPPRFIEQVALVREYGVHKHGEKSWSIVDPEHYLQATYRHLHKYRQGIDIDIDSGLSNLSHAITNLALLCELDTMPKDWDDWTTQKEEITKEEITKEEITKEEITKEEITKEEITKEEMFVPFIPTKEEITKEEMFTPTKKMIEFKKAGLRVAMAEKMIEFKEADLRRNTNNSTEGI